MTKLIFQLDSYLTDFSAVIQDIDDTQHAVTLDATAFFPGGGGQPCDIGWLGTNDNPMQNQVIKVKKIDGKIWHFLELLLVPFAIGQEVKGKIDWVRRYQLMRTHTAMHVLCGVVFRDYGALVTGGDMEPLKGRMDFEFASMSAELAGVIEASVNHEIQNEREVRVNILPRAEAFKIPDLIRTKINLLPPDISEIRTVEIIGLDLQADGGTHVNNIREIGKVRVADYKSKGAINKRIYLEILDC